MPDAESILKPLKIADAIKADAWDAVHSAKSPQDAEQRLRKLPLDNSVRADLFDAYAARGGSQSGPKPDQVPTGETFLGRVGEGIAGAAKGIAGLVTAPQEAANNAVESFSKGNYAEGTGHAVTALAGPLGPSVGAGIVSSASHIRDAFKAAKEGKYADAYEAMVRALPMGDQIGDAATRASGTPAKYDAEGNVIESGKEPNLGAAAGDVATMAGQIFAPRVAGKTASGVKAVVKGAKTAVGEAGAGASSLGIMDTVPLAEQAIKGNLFGTVREAWKLGKKARAGAPAAPVETGPDPRVYEAEARQIAEEEAAPKREARKATERSTVGEPQAQPYKTPPAAEPIPPKELPWIKRANEKLAAKAKPASTPEPAVSEPPSEMEDLLRRSLEDPKAKPVVPETKPADPAPFVRNAHLKMAAKMHAKLQEWGIDTDTATKMSKAQWSDLEKVAGVTTKSNEVIRGMVMDMLSEAEDATAKTAKRQ